MVQRPNRATRTPQGRQDNTKARHLKKGDHKHPRKSKRRRNKRGDRKKKCMPPTITGRTTCGSADKSNTARTKTVSAPFVASTLGASRRETKTDTRPIPDLHSNQRTRAQHIEKAIRTSHRPRAPGHSQPDNLQDLLPTITGRTNCGKPDKSTLESTYNNYLNGR